MITPTTITIADLTEGFADGNGTFDLILKSLKVSLDEQYQLNRINGKEYASAYLNTVQLALQEAMTFVLSKDKLTTELAILDEDLKIKKQQALIAIEQLAKIKAENDILAENLLTAKEQTALLSAQSNKLNEETAILKENRTSNKAIINENAKKAIKENLKLTEETALITKQGLLATAQTTSETTKKTVLAAQKSLYDQQKAGLLAESNTRAAKVWMDVYANSLASGIATTNILTAAEAKAALQAYTGIPNLYRSH